MFTVQFPAAEIGQALDDAQAALVAGRPTCLEQLGIQVLSFTQLAYVEKARGGMGSDGITWAKLQRETLEARVRSRAPAKRIVVQRRELAAQIKATKGSGAASTRAALRKKRKTLSAKLQSMVDAEFAHHEIGVDHGLQRSSAQPGFKGDGDGGNVFVVDQTGVTVGYGRSYSKYFDAKRPLLPSELPAAWLQPLEAIAEKWGGEIVAKEMDKL